MVKQEKLKIQFAKLINKKIFKLKTMKIKSINFFIILILLIIEDNKFLKEYLYFNNLCVLIHFNNLFIDTGDG